MALNFDSGAYYLANRDRVNAQNQINYAPINSYNEVLQTGNTIANNAMDFQDLQRKIEMDKIYKEMIKRKTDNEFGQLLDPNAEVSRPTPVIGKSSFMPGGSGPVATSSPLIESFNNWRAKRMPTSEARPEYMPALSADETKIYQSGLNDKAAAQGVTTQNLLWETASPTQQNMAKAMVEGRLLPSDLGLRDRATIVGLANEYSLKNNVPFTSYQGNVRKGMAENLAYGSMGKNALSLNTALGHTADAVKSFENIKNTNVNWLNKPINWLKENTNDPNIIALDLNLNALHGELANVFKNTGGTDQEISKWSAHLNPNLTPAQYYSAAEKIDGLLRSRLDALQYQQKNVMNEPVANRTLLSPHGAELSKKFQQMGGGRSQQGQPVNAGKIRVKNLKTGQTGTISPQFFDPNKYERVE